MPSFIPDFCADAGGAADSLISSENPFTDISSSDWFYNDVLYAYSLDLIDGMTDTTYEPDGNLTIAQAIKLAACMHQYYYNNGNIALANGPEVWYDTYVEYAVFNGIISLSTYNGQFNAPATRADYVQIFFKVFPRSYYTEIHTIPAGAIPDVNISDPYGFNVYTFYRAGILQGNDDMGTFAPDSNIKRSEVAAIIARMMDPANRITTSYDWAT